MRTEYSYDGNDWSPNADPFHEIEEITKSLIPYIFRGEYEVFNQFYGPLVDYVRRSESRIYYVFNGLCLYGPNPMLQINCSDKRDRVIFRLRIWI